MLETLMTTRHFYIEICHEKGEIIKNNEYVYSVYDGVRVHFDHSLQEHQNVLVYSPDQLKGLIEKYQSSGQSSVLEKIKFRRCKAAGWIVFIWGKHSGRSFVPAVDSVCLNIF